MNSGLYAFAGDSATATDAACANRFEEPMTTVSNMYLGRRRYRCRRYLLRCPYGDRHLDRPPETAGQRLGDRRAQLGLDDVAGERVRDGDQRGVLDDRAQPGQPQVGPLLGRDDPVRQFV